MNGLLNKRFFITFRPFIKLKPSNTEQPGQPGQCSLAKTHLFELENILQKGYVQDENEEKGGSSNYPFN